jgi:predicted phosphodiesterase
VRIGLASDSFGNVGALATALETFARERVDRVFFLGGLVADLDAVLAARGSAPRQTPAPVPESDADFLRAVEGALARQTAAAPDPLADRVVRVASRACPEYATGVVARKHVDMVDGQICCVVHDKAELTRDDISNASVLFHGNSAAAALVQIGPRAFVTPGHLREAAPEGRPATFAILEAGPRELVLEVFAASGAPLRRDRASLVAQAKLSVR